VPAANFEWITSRFLVAQLRSNTFAGMTHRWNGNWCLGPQAARPCRYGFTPVPFRTLSFGALSMEAKVSLATRLRKKAENRHCPGKEECCPEKQAESRVYFL